MSAGLFVPGILVGAAYGRLVGVFVSDVHRSVDESTYALLGSASYMAGSMRLVVSVSVMLLELTNQLSLLPLMMLVLVIAKGVGEGSGVPGVYEILTRVKRFPVLRAQPDRAMRHITAGDLVAHEGEPVSFARVEQVAAILEKLRACGHNGFPVLAASPRGAPSQLLGVVLRHHVLVLLRTGRALQHTPAVTHNSQRIAFMHDVTDFDKPVSSVPPTVDEVAMTLSTQALSMYIDLAPYVNPPSYIVQASTSGAQTYNLFQSLGLRHLCVVPDTPAVLGVITRKDLLPRHAAAVIASKVGTSGAEEGEAADGGGAGPLRRTSSNVAGLSVAATELQPRPGHVGIVRTARRGSPKER